MNPLEQRVWDLLSNDDRMLRSNAAIELRDTAPVEAVDVLVGHLSSPEATLRRRAGSVLALFREWVEPQAGRLARQLQHNEDPAVRLNCAFLLMGLTSPAAEEAYLHALHDPFDKVIRIACIELGRLRGDAATAALFDTLGHEVWAVRLEACKALIMSGVADQRVVEALEALSGTPEAEAHDALIEECQRIESEINEQHPEEAETGDETLFWGKLATIRAQARQIAAENSAAAKPRSSTV